MRYAKMPITAANFNDTRTTAVAYTGTPAEPGTARRDHDRPLYIENGYYFAVEATDVVG